MTETWTPERTDQLSRLWASGLKAEDCGEKLGLSRNQVLGKIYRLKLSTPVFKHPWTEEAVATLTRMWAEGYSQRECAEALGLKRKRVASKIALLQLPEPAQKRFVRGSQNKPGRSKRTKTLYEQLVPRPVNDLSERALHIKFLELEPHHCRFPYGQAGVGEGFTFCGHPKADKSSYCVDHERYCCFEVTA